MKYQVGDLFETNGGVIQLTRFKRNTFFVGGGGWEVEYVTASKCRPVGHKAFWLITSLERWATKVDIKVGDKFRRTAWWDRVGGQFNSPNKTRQVVEVTKVQSPYVRLKDPATWNSVESVLTVRDVSKYEKVDLVLLPPLSSVHVIDVDGTSVQVWREGPGVFVQVGDGAVHGCHSPAKAPRTIYRYIRRKVAGQDCVLTIAYQERGRIGWSVNRIVTDASGRVDWTKSDRFVKSEGRRRADEKLRDTKEPLPRNVTTDKLISFLLNDIPERFRR